MRHHDAAGTAEQLREVLEAGGHLEDDRARAFVDDACLQRYLRARNGDLTKAAAMLRDTLKWRKEHGIDELRADDFADCHYMTDGWAYVAGNDAEGRSVVVFRKRKERIPLADGEKYIRFLAYVIESAVRNMKQGAEQWVWMLDLAVYAPSNSPHPSITLQCLNMLSHHYPERLHKAYFVDAPSIFSVFFRMMSPFVDEKTRQKVEFVHSKEYLAAPAKQQTQSWGAWASSMLGTATHHHGKAAAAPEAPAASVAGSSSGGGGSPSPAKSSAGGSSSGGSSTGDADVLVEEVAVPAPKGPAGGTFSPFVTTFATPYDFARHQRLLLALDGARA